MTYHIRKKKVSTVKLRGRSIWAINEEKTDNWGWKNILKQRQDVRSHMVVKLGNRRSTSLWFDNWSSIGVLSNFVSYRDMYDARLAADMTVKDMVVNDNWNWPQEWYENFPIITQLQILVLEDLRNDCWMWKKNNGLLGNFSVKQVYGDLHNVSDEATWYKVVWFSQNIPKPAFVLWLAVQNRLMTQDRLKKWGSYDMMVCSLCHNDLDSHSHLFFNCKYAKTFWGKIMEKLDIRCVSDSWNGIASYFDKQPYGNDIDSIVKRLGLAASVYMIWQERNFRMFKGEKRGWEELYKIFEETIRLRLLSLKVKPSRAVYATQSKWNVKLNIVPEAT